MPGEWRGTTVPQPSGKSLHHKELQLLSAKSRSANAPSRRRDALIEKIADAAPELSDEQVNRLARIVARRIGGGK